MEQLPQGLSEKQFAALSKTVRAEVGHLSDQVFIHGSRASGTARADSDLDIAIRVAAEAFNTILDQRFGTPNEGSAKARTKQHARESGKIQAGEAGLRALRKQLEVDFNLTVDVSIILENGAFDEGPYVPLIK